MKNVFHFTNGSKYIEVVAANSVEDGHVWIVETNMDFKGLPAGFRNRIKDSDDAAVEKLISSVSEWAKANGFVAMSTYLCRINPERLEAFKKQWNYPNVETWSIEVRAPDETSARDIAFNALTPIGGRCNAPGAMVPAVDLTPEWIHTELVSPVFGKQ